MNFANVKSLVIPEGEVAVIARGEEILWQKSKLPFEYQEVAYLENTGSAYIDTGKFAPLNTDMEVVFQLHNVEQSASNNAAIFGGRNGTTFNTCTLFFIASTKPQYFRFDRSGQIQVGTSEEISIDSSSVYKFSCMNNVLTMANTKTGEVYTRSINNPSSFTQNPIHLFAVSGATFLKGKIYGWRYWENNVLQQDFVPCYRKSDHKPGMYDLVTKAFFTNAGTGEFICPA